MKIISVAGKLNSKESLTLKVVRVELIEKHEFD